MLNRQLCLKRLKGPLHQVLTKGDIAECLDLWMHDNNSLMNLVSPFRWPRLFTNGLPRSILKLNKLVQSWGNFDLAEPISTLDAVEIGKIINDRRYNNSHSQQDYSSNASEIFNTLAILPFIENYVTLEFQIENTNNIYLLCERLNKVLEKFKNFSSYDRIRINLLLNNMITLSQKKGIIAKQLSTGLAYVNKSEDIIFYIEHNKNMSIENLQDYIDMTVARFITAAQFCSQKNQLLEFFKLIKDGSFYQCVQGRSTPLFKYIDENNPKGYVDKNPQIVNDPRLPRSLDALDENSLMQAILIELKIDHNSALQLCTTLNIILDKFNGQTIGKFTITPDLIKSYLVNVLCLDDEPTIEPQKSNDLKLI